MPTPCDFEEDAFQQQVDIALSKLGGVATTPGRVREKVLGYDAAFFFPKGKRGGLTTIVTHPPADLAALEGVHVRANIWKGLSKSKFKVPPFKLNIFMQYKVPVRLAGARAMEMAYWQKPYFRFGIPPAQRDVLCRVDAMSGTDALVFYGSPAFIDAQALWDASEAGDILNRTHFVSASDLKTHGRYTYVDARNRGRAYSEPENIEPVNLPQRVRAALEIAEGMALDVLLGRAAKYILGATEDGPVPIRRLIERSADGPDVEADLKTIRAFEIFYGTRLHIIG